MVAVAGSIATDVFTRSDWRVCRRGHCVVEHVFHKNVSESLARTLVATGVTVLVRFNAVISFLNRIGGVLGPVSYTTLMRSIRAVTVTDVQGREKSKKPRGSYEMMLIHQVGYSVNDRISKRGDIDGT